MNYPDDRSGIFLAPTAPSTATGAPAEEPPEPTVDGSTEAMRRLRHPFDVEPRDDQR